MKPAIDSATPLPSLLSADTAVLPLGSWQTMPRFGIVRGSSCGSMCASVDDCVVTSILGERLLYHYFVVSLLSTESAVSMDLGNAPVLGLRQLL